MASHPLLLRPGAQTRPLIRLSSDFLRAQEYFEAIIASTTDAIIATDPDGRIVYFSPGAEAMLGISSGDTVGRMVYDFYQAGRDEARRIMARLRREGRVQEHDMTLRAADGRRIPISMSASLLKDRSGRVIGTLGISKDMTRRVELETRLRDMVVTDDLTGLYNKRHFHDRLAQEASRARRLGQKLSIILIDLDGFKEVNDRLGHLAGDARLKGFAAAVEASIRKEVDSAYRYGGDEFVMLLPGLGLKRAQEVARRIAAAIDQNPASERIAFSWGAATMTASGQVADTVKLADSRMYRMKASKKRALRRTASSLRRALVSA